jgi:precorrin-2 dehydrogenase/sirohydrochlorin ferrochelatase
MEAKSFIPINLRISGRKVVVVGGGKVAERKVFVLLESGARVLLVSPRITKELRKLSEKGEIAWLQRKYRKGDLESAFMGVFTASDGETEQIFFEEAKEKKVLANFSTDLKKCDFIFPAIVRKGKLLITVCTEGAFPMLSAEIAGEIDEMLSDKYGELVDFLSEIRGEVKKKFPLRERKSILKKVLKKKKFILEALKKGEKPKLEEFFL